MWRTNPGTSRRSASMPLMNKVPWPWPASLLVYCLPPYLLTWTTKRSLYAHHICRENRSTRQQCQSPKLTIAAVFVIQIPVGCSVCKFSHAVRGSSSCMKIQLTWRRRNGHRICHNHNSCPERSELHTKNHNISPPYLCELATDGHNTQHASWEMLQM